MAAVCGVMLFVGTASASLSRLPKRPGCGVWYDSCMAQPPPGRIGPYEITREIGRGGMGVVYLARDTKLDREVAIKALPDELAQDDDRVARFEREANLLASLNHPNIATVFGLEEVGSKKYLVLEYIDGESLIEFLNRNRSSWRKCVEPAAGIAEALAASHARGVVHRDIKPENVLFTRDGIVKLLDFGLALPVPTDSGEDRGATTVKIETKPGTIRGTPGYMAPEQVRGKSADPRSDIFAFGCLLHEMLTGRPTFARDTAADSMAATLKDLPKDPIESGIDIPTELNRVTMRCLEKRPDDRFQSARDLAFSLRGAFGASEAPARTMRIQTPKPSGFRWTIGAVAVVALVTMGIWLFRPEEEEPPRVRSLAVLPFVNDSGDQEADYLAAELPASIIDSLTTLSELHVVPRSTSFRLRNSDEEVTAIGRLLNADLVLIGQINMRGDELRVRAELIDVATNNQQWSHHYDQSLDDTLAVEKEITQRIAQALRLQSTGEEQIRLAKRRPENTEAHLAYLEGRKFCGEHHRQPNHPFGVACCPAEHVVSPQEQRRGSNGDRKALECRSGADRPDQHAWR